MNQYKNLIILDWDDTLFPTSWIIKNNIDLNDIKMQYQYIVFFSRLDTILYQLFLILLKYGKVVIVTNAVIKWINISSNILPNTQKLINDRVIVISARDMYQEKYPNDMYLWKRLIFKQIVLNYFPKDSLQNILSIGDADYEFDALTNLYNENSFNKLRILKSIRFIRDPSFEFLLDQLEVLYNSINRIVISNKHLDLQFQNKY